jgi:hypothetical protein
MCFHFRLGRAGFEPHSGRGMYLKILAKPPCLHRYAMGIAGPHVTAQNRRDYVRWQRNPVRAEFFALPVSAADNQYLALFTTPLDLTNEFRNRLSNCLRMILLKKVDACTEFDQPAVMQLTSELFGHRG